MEKDLILWVSMTRKVLSLKQISGFEKIGPEPKKSIGKKFILFLIQDTGSSSKSRDKGEYGIDDQEKNQAV